METEPVSESPLLEQPQIASDDADVEERRRRLLLLVLVLLLILCCCVAGIFLNYLRKPTPILDDLPIAPNIPPHYLFSIYGVDQPVGVAISPDEERIYVAETGGERLIKVFSRNGDPLFSFAPPNTNSSTRSPVYIAIDSNGRVFVTDRLQNAIIIYDRDGKYIDTILSPTLTLSEYISKHSGGLPAGTTFFYNIFQGEVHYRHSGQTEDEILPAPDAPEWDPLGLRFDAENNLYITDVYSSNHLIRVIPAGDLTDTSLQDFNPHALTFGQMGQAPGQFIYPNTACPDSQGNIYVTDGNNGRVSVWDSKGGYMYEFGGGNGDDSLSLPRGAYLDTEKGHLYVVDAVGQDVKVYDISGQEIVFLFQFGSWGFEDGLFNYPNDIVLDSARRLYIADRENSRIQVWSY